VATVSRVIGDSGYPVAKATRERVLASIAQLGFVPDLIAKTFATSRTNTIGVAMPVLNSYYAKMLMGIEGEATQSGLSILLSIVGDDHGRRENAIDQFLGRRLDGMVICSGAGDGAMDRGPEAIAIPTVIVGQQPDMGFATITVDNRKASYLATGHLIDRGHREIIMLTSNSDWFDFRDRRAGFEARLHEEGKGYAGRIIEGAFNEADAYRIVRDLIAEGTTATAILAATDRQALGTLAALTDLDVAMPEQIAVVGFDNLPTSEFLRPSLTSVDMPADEMGALAIAMIRDFIGPDQIRLADRTLEPRLILRKSS
jgi:DNA-binding LacI/PurR family transcriptional regulator